MPGDADNSFASLDERGTVTDRGSGVLAVRGAGVADRAPKRRGDRRHRIDGIGNGAERRCREETRPG